MGSLQQEGSWVAGSEPIVTQEGNKAEKGACQQFSTSFKVSVKSAFLIISIRNRKRGGAEVVSVACS